jgi:hypothetical protein
MEGIRILRFDAPADRREFPIGHLDLLEAEGLTLGRAEYEPGWRWSEHVGPGWARRCARPRMSASSWQAATGS